METLILRPNSDDSGKCNWYVYDPALEQWQANHDYTSATVVPTWKATRWFGVFTAGKSGSIEPTWNTTIGGKTYDGTVVWICVSILPHFNRVNEEVLDTNNYLYTVQNNRSDQFHFTPHTTEKGSIRKVTLYWTARVTYGTSAKFIIGVNESHWDATTLTTSYTESHHDFTKNPTTGKAWTWADIDSVSADFLGYETLGNIQLAQVYIVVAYVSKKPIYSIF
jgi:hypothetical protein